MLPQKCSDKSPTLCLNAQHPNLFPAPRNAFLLKLASEQSAQTFHQNVPTKGLPNLFLSFHFWLEQKQHLTVLAQRKTQFKLRKNHIYLIFLSLLNFLNVASSLKPTFCSPWFTKKNYLKNWKGNIGWMAAMRSKWPACSGLKPFWKREGEAKT